MIKQRVLVAVSGGVDSAMAAHLLLKQGFYCEAVYMRLHSKARDESARAQIIADKLGIHLHIVDLTCEFKQRVVDPFIEAYLSARTPNPCVQCNKYIKFGALWQKAKELGCDYLATGHYVQLLENADHSFSLKKARDISKDQTYFLYNLQKTQLSQLLFPLGQMYKSEVKAEAGRLNLLSPKTGESQDICFIPNGDYAKFISDENAEAESTGDFVDLNGKVLGKHRGIIHYTIGQRKGIGIAAAEALYVYDINPKTNQVILAGHEHIFSRTLTATEANFLSETKLSVGMRVKAKLRYRQVEQEAIITEISEDSFSLEFLEEQRAICKGQAAVLYQDDCVLAGGIIS